MAKFKVGDRVECIRAMGVWPDSKGKTARVEKVNTTPPERVFVEWDGHPNRRGWYGADGNFKAANEVRSVNPVVANALAANAQTQNSSRSDAILADFKKFVKAQISAAIAALETAKRDISAQVETSAKTAKALHSTDEHEIIRDYGTKTAMAIGEAVSKLKAAKDNPLIL